MTTFEKLKAKNISPCNVCLVRSMCDQFCEDFLVFLDTYLNVKHLDENERNHVVNNILISNNKFVREGGRD